MQDAIECSRVDQEPLDRPAERPSRLVQEDLRGPECGGGSQIGERFRAQAIGVTIQPRRSMIGQDGPCFLKGVDQGSDRRDPTVAVDLDDGLRPFEAYGHDLVTLSPTGPPESQPSRSRLAEPAAPLRAEHRIGDLDRAAPRRGGPRSPRDRRPS